MSQTQVIELTITTKDSGWVGQSRITVEAEFNPDLSVVAQALHLARSLSEAISE